MLKAVSSITNAIGALNFKGTWDANANSPALVSSVGTKGDYYVVGTAGSTNLNGISNWGVGDLATFNGSIWQRVEGGADLNGVNLSVSGTSTLSNLTASTALALNASKEIVSVTNTGTGNNVLATSATFTGTAAFAGISGGTSNTGYSFSASAPAGSLALDNSGRLGINGSPYLNSFAVAINSIASDSANLALQLYKNGVPQILTGDVLGNIYFAGVDNDVTGGPNNIGARIASIATTNWTTDGTTSNADLVFYTHGTASGDAPERARITSTGNVGIGTGATVNYKLEVSTDSAGKPGVGGLWTVVSDERIKSNIVPANLDRCYEIVKSVPLKHFAFAPGVYTDDQIQDKNNLGWIAQDVQKVFKNAVSVKPFTLKTDIPDGIEEYEEQDFTIESVEKTETSIQVIDGKPIQVVDVVTSKNKVLVFDTVDVLDKDGKVVMDGDKPLTYQMPRMVKKTRLKVRHDVIEDCLDLNSGQMHAAMYGAIQALMAKVEVLETRLLVK